MCQCELSTQPLQHVAGQLKGILVYQVQAWAAKAVACSLKHSPVWNTACDAGSTHAQLIATLCASIRSMQLVRLMQWLSIVKQSMPSLQ